jgi:hypothetical protein
VLGARVRAFLGLAGYYHHFIRDYIAIAGPLTQLLRKDGFKWSSEAESTFRVLQQALRHAPVLQLLTFDRAFIMECDASGLGFSVVLHQGDNPVAFFSCQISLHHAKRVAYKATSTS